jgi:hypothetical protein
MRCNGGDIIVMHWQFIPYPPPKCANLGPFASKAIAPKAKICSDLWCE